MGSIALDVQKLMAIDADTLSDSISLDPDVMSTKISLKRYLMVAGQTKDLHKIWNDQPESAFKAGALALWHKVCDAKGKPTTVRAARSGAGWIRHSPAFLRIDLTAMTLKETQAWQKL